MIRSETIDNEARLAALHSLGLMDTTPEEEYDELVQLAAEVCDTPMSLISLVDKRRQWFKAAVGVSFRETPADVSFCAHTIQMPEIFVVEDAQADERFRAMPVGEEGLRIRFYAGVPLRTVEGHAIGALCVMDNEPRKLRRSQERALMVLARQTQTRMELRRQKRALEEALAERDRTAARLGQSETLFRLFMDNIPMLSFIKDEAGRMVFYNAGMAKHFGVTADQWLGLTDEEIWPKEMARQFRMHDVWAMEQRRPVEVAEETTGPNGNSFWRSIKFSYQDADGRSMLAGMALDVTEERSRKAELELANKRLLELAIRDELTGLYNRRAFEARLRSEFVQAQRSKCNLSLLMIDVDNFKLRNDRWGHAAGDEVLRRLGGILSCELRMADMAARFGGEEFTILLPGSDAAGATVVAERLKDTMAAQQWTGSPVTLSIGVSTMSRATESEEQLVQAADVALYRAKRTGKNRVLHSDMTPELMMPA